MTQVRVGLVGCGSHARENLLPSLLQVQDASVAAICDNSEAALRAASRLVPAAVASKTYADVVTPAQVDALVVAGPPDLHVACARLALERGIHVLVEKPPAADRATLCALAGLAGSRRLVTGVAHNLRYAAAVQHVAGLLHEERFGSISSLGLSYLASGPRGPRWGISDPFRAFLLSHAIHALDLLHSLGGTVESMKGFRRPSPVVGCQLACATKFSSGAVGTLLVGSGGANFQLDLLASSDRGMNVRMSGLRSVALSGAPENGRYVDSVWRPRTLDTGYRASGYFGEIEAFIRAVRGGPAYAPSFADELAVYEWIEQLASHSDDSSA